MMAPHPLGALAPLADYAQFIVVLKVPLPDGRTDKIPCDATTGRTHVDAHNPAHWVSYPQAVATVGAWGPQFDVGFVLTAADPFFTVDIDHCLTPTGWSPLALELCQSLPGTVCEVSQSGSGLHIWGRTADMPAHCAKDTALHIECYSTRRFILLGSGAVGAMAPDCPAIRDVVARYFPPRAAAGVSLPDDGPRADWRGPESDEELIRRALASRSTASKFGGGKASFADLWAGDVAALSRAYPDSGDRAYDASSADAALCSHLAFWTGADGGRMERLLRRSALVREKWEREDYLPRTIAAACGQQREVLQDKPPAAATTSDVLAKLQAMTQVDVLANWQALVSPLGPDQREHVLETVQYLSGRSMPVLRKTLRQADIQAAAERSAAAVAQRAASRMMLELRPEDSTQQAGQIEAAIVAGAAPGTYVSFGGVLSHVTCKALPYTHLIDDPEGDAPAVPQIEPLDSVAMLGRVEQVAVLFKEKTNGNRELLQVPERLIDVLLKKKQHAAPVVSGLLTHPVVLRDGSILAIDGLHDDSGLYLQGCNVREARPYTQGEAATALLRLRTTFLEGFEFATALDADIAMAGLFTGVQRRLLDGAPGLAVLASTQSSGKTTLARRIHVMLTGRDMPATTFALGNEAEVAKSLLAMLMRGPAMVCFDNIQDGFTFASGSLSAAMTSASFESRVLGVSRDCDVPTNVLFALTGNNLSLGNDEITRWMTVRLAPKGSRPQERRFVNPDVVAHALQIRGQVLRDVVGIVAGFIAAGASLGLTGSRFPAWDRAVRQPLAWAGSLDVAEVFRSNLEESEDVRAHRALLWSLCQLFADRPFAASEVATHGAVPLTEAQKSLRSALDAIDVKMDGSRISGSIGKRFKALIGKAASVDGQDLKLTQRRDSHDHIDRYRVESAGYAG